MRSAIWACMFLMSTSSTAPIPGRQREDLSGVIRVEVHLHGPRRADERSESPCDCRSRSSKSGSAPSPSEEEARAVPKRRGLEVDRLEWQALGARRRLRERLAADVKGDPADELQEARASRVDHAGLPEDRELLRRPRERLLAGLDDPGERLSRVESLVSRLLRAGRRVRAPRSGSFLPAARARTRSRHRSPHGTPPPDPPQPQAPLRPLGRSARG